MATLRPPPGWDQDPNVVNIHRRTCPGHDYVANGKAQGMSDDEPRRSYAGDLLDAGTHLPAVQQLLGYASPATTSRYDRRGNRARRASAERLHLDVVPGRDP